MKKGFTLAEILVTLAIIGVVAAITIPSTLHNIQKQILYNQFIGTYNVFSRAFQLLKVESAIESSYVSSKDNPIPANELTNEILSKLKYSVKCQAHDRKCFKNDKDIKYKYIDKRQPETGFFSIYPIYSLPNGADFRFTQAVSVGRYSNHYMPLVHVDVNGIDKGPNTYGRDFFQFTYAPYYGVLFPIAIGDATEIDEENQTIIFREDIIDFLCDPNYSGPKNGSSCGLRLLREKKMDY